jgi:hypothetical protein
VVVPLGTGCFRRRRRVVCFVSAGGFRRFLAGLRQQNGQFVVAEAESAEVNLGIPQCGWIRAERSSSDETSREQWEPLFQPRVCCR